MLGTFVQMTQSSSLLTSWKEVVVESHIKLALTSIAHGAQPMAREPSEHTRVGGAHRAPYGPRHVRRSRSLFAVLCNM